MTFVNHEVMGDNRLVSNDGCVEAKAIAYSLDLHLRLPQTIWWLLENVT